MKLHGQERAMYWVYVVGFSLGAVVLVVVAIYSLYMPGSMHQ